MPFSKCEAMIAEYGHYPDKPKVAHVAFNPDIVMSVDDKLENRFFLEYVHTEKRYVFDLRGMRDLSNTVKKARRFVLVVNNEIYKLKGVECEVESMPLSLFQKHLKRDSKKDFIKYLDG